MEDQESGIIAQRDARIEELEAHCLRLGQGGAERYWENRWRETDAELARQAGRLEQMEPHFLEVVEYVNTAGFANWGESCHKTLINDHRRLAALKAQPRGVDDRAAEIANRLQGLIEEMGEDGYHGSEICIAAHDYLRNHGGTLNAGSAVPDQALLSDVVMHLTDWLDLHECECENGHVCGRGHVRATRDKVKELLAATPTAKKEG